MNPQATAALPPGQAAALADSVLDMWRTGGTIAQAKGITEQECEALYAWGHSLYAQRKYEDAFRIFAQLVAWDHMESRYQMALACAMQASGRYADALQQFMVVAVMRLDDPAPVFHGAECQLALGQSADADQGLALAIDLCRPGEHDAIAARAKALRAAIASKK
jgi:type III secretion system low calcium response chaperone LcrH/SycD